ncbi:hypothetical protein SAMN05192583_3262 [Sphingomonas gellani]|uniref:Uncharacterized protein n=1 Tax=Sphingomonas gellani TaxID=1166340 RepID=A0A1H8I922_9SPHN|nr:hypothetical protein [Sphingomonas gellani]SEN65280.1 hypothetical protein SAMN05192583_3262 [Sphingomonas gellani]
MEEVEPRAVVGWKQEETRHGVVLTLQLIGDREAYREHRFDHLPIVLGDRQLRSLARDLARATTERGMEVFAPKRWWRFGR